MEQAWDYLIEVSITVDISELYCGELNTIGADQYVETNLAEWVLDAFGSHISENEDEPICFKYNGKKLTATFAFQICDDSEDEADSFVGYRINKYELPDGIKYCSHYAKAAELWEDCH